MALPDRVIPMVDLVDFSAKHPYDILYSHYQRVYSRKNPIHLVNDMKLYPVKSPSNAHEIPIKSSLIPIKSP